VAKPRATGVLVLDVESWPSNTRLYKAIDKSGLQVECRVPEKNNARLCKWLQSWSRTRHGVRLDDRAVSVLVDLVGPQLGLLDQELAKLALYAGADGQVGAELFERTVGGWRTKTTWQMVDAASEGKTAEALEQLSRLLQGGEHPLALFGQIAWSLRRYAAALRIYDQAARTGQRMSLADALAQAGFRELRDAEPRMKQLGRDRVDRLYRWLLEADLAMKGSHSQPDRARFVLEQLIIRLSNQLSPARHA
jgi:DNA polymerase-3 subunit delta